MGNVFRQMFHLILIWLTMSYNNLKSNMLHAPEWRCLATNPMRTIKYCSLCLFWLPLFTIHFLSVRILLRKHFFARVQTTYLPVNVSKVNIIRKKDTFDGRNIIRMRTQRDKRDRYDRRNKIVLSGEPRPIFTILC